MKCPACNGNGGEYDPILWNGVGGGPYYECPYCKGTGKVSLFKWLRWKYYIIKDAIYINITNKV